MNQPQSLPSGTVAFLFTDIEGSTARWDSYRVAMQEALRRHDAIMRTAIQSHAGHVFKTVGDAFCAAFERADDALNAALAAQREIGAADWKAVNGLRVRMAVNVGETDERDGDYFGPAVNRVARLLSAGHGGQVLVSGPAAEAAAPTLPAGVGLRSLGMLPLRGLRQPERVFQLTAAGLRSAFKPLRALETPPNNLPRRASSFVGRREEVAGVEEMLRAHPLVTIAGTGGVGKTRLALEAADELLNDMRDGAWFVDLAPLVDPALVASTILSSLSIDQASNVPARDVLIGALTKRELLLVLDNCEHLIDEAARIVSAIGSTCPRVTVLATSREVLNIDGEQVYRLSSLGDAEAVELFTERAQAGNPAFQVTERNRTAVEELCRRLDGIALAIELAAARIRTVSLDELSRRLRLRMLAGTSRDRQARQQTMEALIDWSYELLAPNERSLFRELGVFVGGFTLEGAMAVVDGDTEDPYDVLEGLTSLADKSLLVVEARDADNRYRLLEPIREYARERLDATGATETVLQRHADAFAELAERTYVEWDTAPAPDWLARTAGELDNFRGALEWALAAQHDVGAGARIASGVSPMFLRLSLLREGVGWGERALEFAEQLGPGVGARLHYGLSMMYHNLGANAPALASARRAAELYRAAGDERGLTRALSQVAHHLGDASDDAREVVEEALAHARALGDRRLLAATLQRCAFTHVPMRIETAREYFNEAVALFRSLGRDDETARALAAWADAEGAAGEWATAAGIVSEALELGGDDSRLYFTNALASLYVALGDTARAQPTARETLRLATEKAHPIATPQAMLYLAAVASHSESRMAAGLFGYAQAQLRTLAWVSDSVDRAVENAVQKSLHEVLEPETLESLRAAGALWSETEAVAVAMRL